MGGHQRETPCGCSWRVALKGFCPGCWGQGGGQEEAPTPTPRRAPFFQAPNFSPGSALQSQITCQLLRTRSNQDALITPHRLRRDGQPSIHSFIEPAFTDLLLIADSEERLLPDGMLLPPPLVGQQGRWVRPWTHQGQGLVARAAHPPGHGAGGRCEPSCSSPGRSVALSAGAPHLLGERVRRVRWDKKDNAPLCFTASS